MDTAADLIIHTFIIVYANHPIPTEDLSQQLLTISLIELHIALNYCYYFKQMFEFNCF